MRNSICLYISEEIFSADGTDGPTEVSTRGPRGPKNEDAVDNDDDDDDINDDDDDAPQLRQLLHLPDQAPVQPRRSAGRDHRHGGGHHRQHCPGTATLTCKLSHIAVKLGALCDTSRALVMKVYREIVSELLVLAGDMDIFRGVLTIDKCALWAHGQDVL